MELVPICIQDHLVILAGDRAVEELLTTELEPCRAAQREYRKEVIAAVAQQNDTGCKAGSESSIANTGKTAASQRATSTVAVLEVPYEPS